MPLLASSDRLGSASRLIRREQSYAVVRAYCGRMVVVHGIEDADGVCLVGQVGDLGRVGPAERRYFVADDQQSPGDLAAEDQRDDAAGHVLVDTRERDGLDVKPGLLADLAASAGDGAGCGLSAMAG